MKAKLYILGVCCLVLFVWAAPALVVSYLWHSDMETAQFIIDTKEDQIRTDEEILSILFGEKWDLNKLRMEEVTVSAYNSTVDQCDSRPWETASGSSVSPNCAATSRDLPIPFDKRMLLVGEGVTGFVRNEDTMGRYKGKGRNRQEVVKGIDLWMSDRTAAMKFGVKPGVTVMWLDNVADE